MPEPSAAAAPNRDLSDSNKSLSESDRAGLQAPAAKSHRAMIRRGGERGRGRAPAHDRFPTARKRECE